MPRPLRLTALCLGLLAQAAVAPDPAETQEADPCPVEFDTSSVEAAGLVRLDLRTPCAPYAPVRLTYGPFDLTEETDADGTLSVTLPRLADGTRAAAEVARRSLTVAPQGGRASPDFVAVAWPGGRVRLVPMPGLDAAAPAFDRLTAGFPLDPDAPLTRILVTEAGSMPPVVLRIPLSEGQCGRTIEGRVMSADDPTPRPLRLRLPACAEAAGAISLPLTP